MKNLQKKTKNLLTRVGGVWYNKQAVSTAGGERERPKGRKRAEKEPWKLNNAKRRRRAEAEAEEEARVETEAEVEVWKRKDEEGPVMKERNLKKKYFRKEEQARS